MLQAIILGLIQGATEFLPVSSTAHLVLIRWITGWSGDINSLSFDVALHTGTFISLLACFYKDIIHIIKEDRRLLALIIIGTIPAGVSGVLFEETVENTLRSPYIIVFTLVIFGLLLIYAERFNREKGIESIGLPDILVIGFAQAIALIPGVSRSGITISAALLLGLGRTAGARISFLLSIPVIGGAAGMNILKLFNNTENHDLAIFGVGAVTSAISGYFAIKFLLDYLVRHKLNVFAYYRFILAAIIGIWIWLRI